MTAEPEFRCLLIGGRSNAGKSTVAAHLAERLGWTHLSTDQLGRHPGRPWGTVPPHVAAHYAMVDDAAILDALIAHQRAMWPGIEAIVRQNAVADRGLILEGAALMPKEAAALGLTTVAAVWLTGDDIFFRRRIEAESGYREADPPSRALIDRFIERNRGLDVVLRAEAAAAGLPVIDVSGLSVADVADRCLVAAQRLG